MTHLVSPQNRHQMDPFCQPKYLQPPPASLFSTFMQVYIYMIIYDRVSFRLYNYIYIIPQTIYCWGSILEKTSWPHSLAAPLNSVAGLCGPTLCPGLVLLLSSSCSPSSLLLGFHLKKELATLTDRAPELCGWALCPGLVFLLCSSCPSLVLLLSFSWPRP